jgi:hypothetical protein
MRERIIETTDVGTDEQLMLTIEPNERLSVGDEPVRSISAIGDGIVALATTTRTVHISAADYWRLLYGDVPPSKRQAGLLAAQLAHVRGYALT